MRIVSIDGLAHHVVRTLLEIYRAQNKRRYLGINPMELFDVFNFMILRFGQICRVGGQSGLSAEPQPNREPEKFNPAYLGSD